MDITLFNDLERLSGTGNFSQTAKLGNISQPAFSRRIKTLEAWVGATLIDRSHQPVTLTAAGTQMLEVGLRSLSYIEKERSQVLETQSLPESLIDADLASKTLVRAGRKDWTVALDIRLHRNEQYSNRLTRSIWSFLEARQSLSLLSAACPQGS